mgnify:CR=1 FL=1
MRTSLLDALALWTRWQCRGILLHQLLLRLVLCFAPDITQTDAKNAMPTLNAGGGVVAQVSSLGSFAAFRPLQGSFEVNHLRRHARNALAAHDHRASSSRLEEHRGIVSCDALPVQADHHVANLHAGNGRTA